MADVRAAAGFDEVEPLVLTFTYDGTIVWNSSRYDLSQGSAQVGKAVSLVGASQVGLGVTTGYVLGKVIKVERDIVTVQVAGVVSLPYLGGSIPTIGRGITLDGAGNAQQAAGGTRAATERGIVLFNDTVNLITYVYLP